MTVEAPQALICASCGGGFELSARVARGWRSRGEEPVCRMCRRLAKPPDPLEQARMRKWWTDRYSVDELLELGREIGWV